jgi:protein ImuA
MPASGASRSLTLPSPDTEAPDRIDGLRRQIARLERPDAGDRPLLPTGIAGLDARLGGGFDPGGLHEIAAATPADAGAATGFALALAGLAAGAADRRRPVGWIAEETALAEAGLPYAAGLSLAEPGPRRLILVRTRHRAETLWALEEAVRCGICAAVLGDLWEDGRPLRPADSRRLVLACGRAGTPVLLMRSRPCPEPLPAMSRFVVAASPAARDSPSSAPARFDVSLIRSRCGAPGRFLVECLRHDPALPARLRLADPAPAPRRTGAVSGAVAVPSADRPAGAA